MLLEQSSSQLLKTHFIGRDGFVWWVGQVAARESSKWDQVDLKNKKEGEELYYNRVKVRIFGYHTGNCQDLPDDKLPWAHILIPPGESNGVGKVGKAHGYQGGETVMGFFLDGDDAQQPVIFGSLYKSSEIESINLSEVVEKSCSEFKPFNPYQSKSHNSLPNKESAGKNVGTGEGSPEKKGVPASGNKSGIENVAAEQGEDKDIPAAIANFSEKVDNKAPRPSLCNNNRFANITAAIESLLKKLKKWQNVANTYYKDKIRNKITDFSGEIRKVANIVSGDIASYIKIGMNFLFEKLSKQLGLTFGGLYPKTKQSEVGKKIDIILEAIYMVFKQLGLSLPGLIGDALTNFVGNAVGASACAVQNFLGQLLSKILNLIEDAILPLLDQLNAIFQGVLGSVASILSEAMNLIGVINQFLNYVDPKVYCPKPQIFSMAQGISFGSVVSDINGIINGVGNVGKLVGNIGEGINSFGEMDLTKNTCDPKKKKCGPPKIVIAGGGGSGAEATAVVNKKGKIVGAILKKAGKGYISPPTVSIIDDCDIGGGAYAQAVLPQIPPNSQYLPGSPQNPGSPIDKIIITQPGEKYLNTPIQIEYGINPNTGIGTTIDGGIQITPITGILTQPISDKLVGDDGKEYVGVVTDVQIVNPGYGYDENTIVNIGNCPTKVQIGPDGEIIKVDMVNYCPVDDIPPVIINSDGGASANLVPVIGFTEVSTTSPQVAVGQTVVSVIDCV